MDIFDPLVNDPTPGLRIHNPGNVKHPRKGTMRGGSSRQPHRNLHCFTDSVYGIRALANQEIQGAVPGVTTLGDLFPTPVINLAGLDRTTVFVRETHLEKLVAASIERRCGWQPYTQETIATGCRMA